MKRFQQLHLVFAGVLAVLVIGALTTIRAQEQASEPMLLELHPEPLKLLRGDDLIAEFDLEIADDADERSRGLMFREEFPPNRAMLFVFEDEKPVSFWMRNTPRPLDIVFVAADGEIRSIARDTEPFSEAPIPSGAPVRYALEVNAGIVNYLKVDLGDRLSHPAITAD